MQSPNRHLSMLTVLKVFFGGARVQIGSLIFWAIMSFIVGYVTAYGMGIHWSGEWLSTQGIYQGIDESNVEVNDEPVYAYYFVYNVNGQSYEGVSYDYYKNHAANQPVEVEYRSNNPMVSRIYGMSLSPTGNILIWILLVLCIIPALLLVFGLRDNQKYLYLLRHGLIAQGTYLRSRPTGTTINEVPEYEYEFSFQVDGATHIAKCRTHLHHRVEDEKTETILYDPRNPSYCMVSDAISDIKPSAKKGLGRKAGQELPQAGWGAILYTILPLGGALVAWVVWQMNL